MQTAAPWSTMLPSSHSSCGENMGLGTYVRDAKSPSTEKLGSLGQHSYASPFPHA